MIMYIFYMCSALDLIKLYISATFIYQYINAAKRPVMHERRLSNDRNALSQPFARHVYHRRKVALDIRHLTKLAEKPHSQISDLISHTQRRLVKHRIVISVRHIFPHPQNLRTLHCPAVQRLRQVKHYKHPRNKFYCINYTIDHAILPASPR